MLHWLDGGFFGLYCMLYVDHILAYICATKHVLCSVVTREKVVIATAIFFYACNL